MNDTKRKKLRLYNLLFALGCGGILLFLWLAPPVRTQRVASTMTMPVSRERCFFVFIVFIVFYVFLIQIAVIITAR